MDAHAHLKGLGWRGTGHSLDKTDRGLKRPLLISHKHNLHGLGSKSQKEKQADQWWLNAFDNALKDIGTGKESALANVREHGVNRGGLYGFFVKGQVLESTLQKDGFSTATVEPIQGDTDPSDPESSVTSSNDTNTFATSLGNSATMGPRRNSGGHGQRGRGLGRNTNLVNGANSMPLGNNRMLNMQKAKEDEHGAEKKRKRTEEPAETSSGKPEKRAKGADGAAIKPHKKDKAKKDGTVDEAVLVKRTKSPNKPTKIEVAVSEPEPTEVSLVLEAVKEKTKKSKKTKDPLVELVKEKSKTSKKAKQIEDVPEIVSKPIVEKKTKKSKENVVEPFNEPMVAKKPSSNSPSDPESAEESPSESDDYSDVDTESDSEFDSDSSTASDSDADDTDAELEAAAKHDEDSFAAHPTILKVVNGVAIPAPQPIIREKKKKERAKDIRERRKKERTEKARQNAIENKKRALAAGTFDFEADEKRRKERMIDKMCKQELRRRENAGEFGPKLPHPSILLKMEKDILKELKRQKLVDDPNVLEIEKKMMHEKLIEMGVTGLNQNRKVKYKEEKFKREKLKREAARDIKARERHRVFGTEYTPADLMSEYDKKKSKEETKERLKAERRESRKKKAIKNEEKEAEKKKRKEEKVERRRIRKENKKKTAEGIAALKAQKAAEEAAVKGQQDSSVKENGLDMFAGGADEIKLGINIDGRTRTIPGKGKVAKYPSKAEKLRTKIESRAFEAGITYEEMEEIMEKEKQEKMAPEKKRIAELQKARGGLTSRQWHHYCTLAQMDGQEEAERFFFKKKAENEARAAAAANGNATANSSSSDGDVLRAVSTNAAPNSASMSTNSVSAKGVTNGTSTPEVSVHGPKSKPESKPLSEEKRRKYAAKAAKKGISIGEYIAQHESKKAAKDNVSDMQATAITTTIDTKPGGLSLADQLLARAKSGVVTTGFGPEASTNGFIIDTTGDPHLNNTEAPTEELGFIVDTSGDHEILTRPKPVLRWHPDMLGDRKVKQLSKEERKARLEWMRERRAARHAEEGKIPLSKKERHKLRMEKKQRQRNTLVAQIMTEKGKPREQVSKEELEVARRAAKRVMREEKRIKRDKVIHRKKLGGGLRGQFGGTISMGGRS